MIMRLERPRLHLTPADPDHGRRVSLGEFEHATGEEGYQYELIDGRIDVSHLPELPHENIENWIHQLLLMYCWQKPKIINYVSTASRVYVHDRPLATCPEPDIAAYRDFPTGLPRSRMRWRDVSPILVVEVISPDSADKDLTRNVPLYLAVPSIREYWIVDLRPDPDYPSLLVYRRRGRKWQKPIAVAAGETYTTKLLPGFALKLDAPGA
jgi:Uma2 family endonuclease